MLTQTLRRFLRAYTAALVVSTTSLLVGSAVAVNQPKQIYIPYTVTPAGLAPELCAVAYDHEMLPRVTSGDTAVALAVYRTVAFSDCDQQPYLFI